MHSPPCAHSAPIPDGADDARMGDHQPPADPSLSPPASSSLRGPQGHPSAENSGAIPCGPPRSPPWGGGGGGLDVGAGDVLWPLNRHDQATVACPHGRVGLLRAHRRRREGTSAGPRRSGNCDLHHSVGWLFLYGALDSHLFFPSRAASGRFCRPLRPVLLLVSFPRRGGGVQV